MVKILFVCLGNICRSPMAEIVMKHILKEQGREDLFEIDSAGTEGYNALCRAGIHHGTKTILRQMHIPFEEHISRLLTPQDYQRFDYILAMDAQNVTDILSIVGCDTDKKIHRLLDFTSNPRNIKDPWYTGNFDETYWDVYEGCQAFLDYLNTILTIEV